MATKKTKKTVSPATVAKKVTETKTPVVEKEEAKAIDAKVETTVAETTQVDEPKTETVEVEETVKAETTTVETAQVTETTETAATQPETEETETTVEEEDPAPETSVVPAAKEPVTKTETVKEEVKAAPATEEVSAAVAQFNRLAKSYLDIAKTSSTSSGSSRAASTNAFITLMDFVCTSKDRKVLEAFYNFFVTNRKGMLAHNVVLAGVANLDATRRIRVGTFYTTFFALANYKVDKVPFRLDLNAIRLVTNDAVTNYVAMKLR